MNIVFGFFFFFAVELGKYLGMLVFKFRQTYEIYAINTC